MDGGDTLLANGFCGRHAEEQVFEMPDAVRGPRARRGGLRTVVEILGRAKAKRGRVT
jgi:hypothetical protein